MAWFTVFTAIIVIAFVGFAMAELAFRLAWWPGAKSIVVIAITASVASIAAASSAAASVEESFVALVLVASSFVVMAAIPSTQTNSLTM